MQETFRTSIRDYMSTPVLAASPDESLGDVYRKLLDAKVSSLAVTSDDKLVGVVSRTDFLREGRRAPIASQTLTSFHHNIDVRHLLLEFPNKPVSEIMTRSVDLASASTTIAEAGKRMCDKQMHRVFVGEDEKLLGVFSTLDLMRAIRDGVAKEPISEFMTSPVEVIDVEETVAQAVDKLAKTGVSGLIAVENEWPVGVFTQVEAMAARDLEDDTLVEDAMDPALICMPTDTRMHRAAQQALRMRVRRIVVSESRHMRGILSGLDFARYAARGL